MSKDRISLDEKVRRATRAKVDSWVPFDLNELSEEPPTMPTLGNAQLLYPGKRHVFSGPPESAKTLAAYCLLLQTVRQDETAVLIDFEMGPRDARQRLRELGATPEEISLVKYLEPEDPWTPERVKGLLKVEPALVVVDAAAGAYELQGLDDNKRGEVESFNRMYVTTFWREGIATLMLDHVVKSSDDRGRFVIGSERKLGATDVHIGFETVKAVSRGSSGRYKLITHKDRGGYLTRGHLADFHLESDPETHAITWKFTTPDSVGEDGVFRPTHLMEKASIQIETSGVSPTKTELATSLGGRKKFALAAIDRLVAEGFAVETADGRSKVITSQRRYREADPGCNPEIDETVAPSTLCESPPRTTDS